MGARLCFWAKNHSRDGYATKNSQALSAAKGLFVSRQEEILRKLRMTA